MHVRVQLLLIVGLILGICLTGASGQVYSSGSKLPKPGELKVDELKKFFAVSAALVKHGQQAGEQLDEQKPLPETKLAQAKHAFLRAAHAVALRNLRLKHAAELEEIGDKEDALTLAAQANGVSAKTEELPMTKLHWGHGYLKDEYGDDWAASVAGFHASHPGCQHMFTSLCNHDERIIDDWWKDHGWSHEGADLVHAAHYDERQEEIFHQAVQSIHQKIVEHRGDRVDWEKNRTAYLTANAQDRDLEERKKAFFQKEENDETVADLAKSSAAINSGLLHSLGNDNSVAYASYGTVEATAAEEEMQEMSDWHELIQSMKHSGKADPLYVKEVEKQGAAMMKMVRNTMLRLHNQVALEHQMTKKDQAKVSLFEQQQHAREEQNDEKEREYEQQQAEERGEAETEAAQMLDRHSKDLQGQAYGQAGHVQAEAAASKSEVERANEMALSKSRSIAETKAEVAKLEEARKGAREREAALKEARRKSKAAEEALKKHEEAEAKEMEQRGLEREREIRKEHMQARKTAEQLLHHEAVAPAARAGTAAEKPNLTHSAAETKAKEQLHAEAEARRAKAQTSLSKPSGAASKPESHVKTAEHKTANAGTQNAAKPFVGIPPKFAKHARAGVGKHDVESIKLVYEPVAHRGPVAAKVAAADQQYQKSEKQTASWTKLSSMLLQLPVSLLQVASKSLTAAKTHGVALQQTGSSTPWARQKAFMAALQQQMIEDGDSKL